MASTPIPPPVPPSAAQLALDDARKKYEALFDALDKAYFDAKTVADKMNIQKQKSAVHEILTGITQAQIGMNTEEMKTLTDVVNKTNDALEDLQVRIASIVSNIELVGEVESAIGGVLNLAGKFL